jgi:hypothetical protein
MAGDVYPSVSRERLEIDHGHLYPFALICASMPSVWHISSPCSPAAMEDHLSEGSEDNFHVEPKRPVLDVEVVVAGPVGDRGVPT